MSVNAKELVGLDLQERVGSIQKMLQSENLDGWLFYYFKENDPIAFSILGRDPKGHFSRRWFYFVPAFGEPVKLVHRIEMGVLDDLPGSKSVYLSWKELEGRLKEMLSGKSRVAMQYSPRNAVPYLSRVDAGTVELIQGVGVEVVSSANLVQAFEARWNDSQLETHKYAVKSLRSVVDETFGEVKRSLDGGIEINEYDIQCFMMSRFEHYGLTTNSPPIVAINEHSGSPHYQPTKEIHSPIRKGDFLLIDLWAKRKDDPLAIYGDITWTGFIGKEVPEKYTQIFDIVAGARDAAVDFVRAAVADGKTLYGCEVDDVARKYITDAGYGEYFVHRTGHSIGVEVHGNGANIDNLETREERKLIPQTGFSIEPGIYMDEFGVRSEIDVYLGDGSVEIFGQPIQRSVVPILA